MEEVVLATREIVEVVSVRDGGEIVEVVAVVELS